MNRVIWFLRGYCVCEITGATPEWALNRLTAGRIPFWNVVWIDAFTLKVSVLLKDRREAERLAEAAMCQWKLLQTVSFYQSIGGVLQRPVLLVMLLLSIGSALLLPKFSFFFSVEGNEIVPDAQILQALEGLNIGFGRYGPSIKPQWVKDHMLNLIPELQWVTVTQSGCKATVVVRERPAAPKTENRKALAHVIATQSGMITKQSILAGQPLCKVGDIVEKGQMLVSGLVDLERVTVVENAKAEIYAVTWRQKKTVMPAFFLKKRYTEEPWQCVWLLLGEKRIKIFGNSGIFGAACDKMIERKILSLPDNLDLPIGLEIETFRPYEMSQEDLSENLAQMLLTSHVERVTKEDMNAGEIQKRHHVMSKEDTLYCLSSLLECHEMIGESVEAEWTEEEMTDD